MTGVSYTCSGVTTLAFLKANFDHNRDHIEMFLPLVLDSIRRLPPDYFSLEDVRAKIRDCHSLNVPESSLRILLKRAATRDYLVRAGGMYKMTDKILLAPDISKERTAIEAKHAKLVGALVCFSRQCGKPFATDEEALAALLAFLSQNHTALLIDSLDGTEISFHIDPVSPSQSRVVALFIQQECSPGSDLLLLVQCMLEGLVLQNALLLKDIAEAPRKFRNLVVYLDSGLILELLGLTGELTALASREMIDLLRELNVSIAAFDKTLRETKRILAVYERHLGTPDGIASLRPTALTRYLVTHHFSPSDVAEIISTLQKRIEGLGIKVHELPNRDRNYTLNEESLQSLLKGSHDDELSPRVVHDVDCTAAILTLRQGRTSQYLDDCKAVFATNSGQVVRSVREWYAAEGETGISPVVHSLALSHVAWLKKPASASKLKLHELMALCSAAISPTRKTWEKFLEHLRRLVADGAMSTDELVAIAASSLADRLLSDCDDDPDEDAHTISEVIERVREDYKKDSENRVRDVEEDAARRIAGADQQRQTAATRAFALEKERRETLLSIATRSRSYARRVSLCILCLMIPLIVLGQASAVIILPGIPRWLISILSLLAWTLGVVSFFTGGFLLSWKNNFENWLDKLIKAKLLEISGLKEDPPEALHSIPQSKPGQSAE